MFTYTAEDEWPEISLRIVMDQLRHLIPSEIKTPILAGNHGFWRVAQTLAL